MIDILMVEDDLNLGHLLKENLENKGLSVIWCRDGAEGVHAFASRKFDLCIIDVMLPAKDGFAVVKEIRTLNNNIPIIFLTAKSLPEDKIKGFESGCDDYITKPFNGQELYLRIKAVLKRSIEFADELSFTSIGLFQFNHNQRILKKDEIEFKLSSKEAEVINLLLQNKGKVVQRDLMLEHVWGSDSYFSSKSMDVYMSKVRKLLKGDPNIEILNAYGIGFKLIIKNSEPDTPDG